MLLVKAWVGIWVFLLSCKDANQVCSSFVKNAYLVFGVVQSALQPGGVLSDIGGNTSRVFSCLPASRRYRAHCVSIHR